MKPETSTPQSQIFENGALENGTTVSSRKELSVADVRKQLAGQRGPQLWRSLDELAGSEGFREMVDREFPQSAIDWSDGFSRRSFLQVMGASLAFGGLAACTRQPFEKIVPYVEQPEQIVPGQPLFFATSMTMDGFAQGLLAESHMGRPTKIEGNPEHPMSLGATDLFAQASILDLYDPDRLHNIHHLGRIRSWNAFVDETTRALAALEALGGARLRILTPTVTSPTLGAVIDEVLAKYPNAKWHQYDPVGRNAERVATERTLGEAAGVQYDYAQADVVVALDADFLTQGLGSVRAAKDFMSRRKPGQGEMSRLWAFESTPTGTGSVADERIAATPAEINAVAMALAARFGVAGIGAAELPPELAAQVDRVAADLEAHRGSSIVVPGPYASPDLHVLALAINQGLGNISSGNIGSGGNGSTVRLTEAAEVEPVDTWQSIAELANDMEAGEVDALVIVGGNPVFDAPADLDFANRMFKVGRRIYLGQHRNETAEYCQWVLAEAHYLECWGDARSSDGTLTLQQPLIEPLYGGKSAAEVLSALTEEGERSGEELLKAQWADSFGADEKSWRKALHDGFLPGSASADRSGTISAAAVAAAIGNLATAGGDGIELALRPDPTVWDGRFANNGWLQECPKPFTKLTWDNALLMSPALAGERGVKTNDLVTVTVSGRSLEVPVWVHPGQAKNAVTLHLGYGRANAGRVGSSLGFNANTLRTTDFAWGGPVSIDAAGGTYQLASTQLHSNIAPDPWQGENLEGRTAEKRHLVRTATLDEFEHHPEFAQHVGHGIDDSLTMMPEWPYDGYSWGMTVDLNACTGCNACVVACQSENNIPVVGKEQVALGREMHWIRIDRYYEGELDDPELHHQPVMCQHCEQAPCEVVCPVSATVHSDEGLNDMVYNRCVGTRYCADNCPYKVRRFNFHKYHDSETELLKLARNPDVSTRFRGVMEKCSYCVQRINQARSAATREGREIADGDFQTACQQVCPTEAIVFGNINDAESAVSKSKANPLNYGILSELGTRPRTTYLAKVKNTDGKSSGGGEHS